jgi:signal transduction histidine kinase
VTLSLSANGGLVVRCDARKVKQVLINLMQNALDASSSGGSVAIELDDHGGDGVVRVCDRGSGLPGELLARLCEPGVTTKAHGSGLGLTIVRMIAEQHGGRFALANRDGGGCVAELRLPRHGAGS